MLRTITTWHLELTRPSQLVPSRRNERRLDIRRAETVCPELNRFLYTAVGGGWLWIDRLSWSYARWTEWLDRPELETWVAFVGGNPAGYFELERQPGDNVEIAYFGMLPQFVGQGLGGLLLTGAAERGFEMGASRVWVHTCSLDHPNALAAYQARGFRIFRIETHAEDGPETPVGPWAGNPDG